MSEDELDALYENVNRPYTSAELDTHLKWHDAKSALEFIHSHNLSLIELVRDWTAFVRGEGPKPDGKLWRLLMPGRTMDNPACTWLETVVEFFSQFDHGDTPRMPIVVSASQSTMTLIEALDELYHTENLDAAMQHIRNFFSLITYGGRPTMKRTSFAEKLRYEMSGFTANCSANAHKLGLDLISRIRSDPDRVFKPATAGDIAAAAGRVTTAIDKGTKKISRACRKMKGRKPKFSVDKMEAVWTIHENARNNQAVKDMHPKGMATRGNEYLYCKRELTALDIHSVNQYSDILDARIKRVSRKQDS